MLDQLVESKTNASGENKREARFLAVTLLSVVALLLTTMTYSLFAKEFALDQDGLELSSRAAPPVEIAKPPQPEAPQPVRQQQSAPPSQSNVILRKDAFEQVDQPTKAPVETTGQKDVQSWVKGARLSEKDVTSTTQANLSAREGNEKGTGITDGTKNSSDRDDDPPPVASKKTQNPQPAAVETKKPVVVSSGVVNGKAINLIKPQYPAAAKAVRAGGIVNVQVTIDENGNIISASAVSGHRLLRQAAEQAARASKFTPTYLSKQPVKVTGVIVYNFAAQ